MQKFGEAKSRIENQVKETEKEIKRLKHRSTQLDEAKVKIKVRIGDLEILKDKLTILKDSI